MIKTNNKTIAGTFLGILVDILIFPFWWYSFGLIKFVKVLLNFLSNQEKFWALSVWARNIFTPMYGLRDWQGRIISFFVRFFQVIFRSVVMIFWMMILSAILFAYLAFPILVVYEIFFQFS